MTHLYLEKRPPVVLLQLLAPLLQPAPPLPVPPQQLDVVHRRLQDAALVLPHVSHLCRGKSIQNITLSSKLPLPGAPHIIITITITANPHQFIVGFILGWEQCAELFDPIVDVEPTSTLNWEKIKSDKAVDLFLVLLIL